MNARDKWSRVTVTLARYAEYSNIGGNRTGGFGVTRYEDDKNAKPRLDSA
jgi:CRISPR/Cas system endoribonuclease Cas6 (RAMP superfamily)